MTPTVLRRRIAVGAALLAGALVLSGCTDSSAAPAGVLASGPATGYAGTVVDPAFPLPPGQFTGTDGAPYRFTAPADGHALVIFFGYSHCPDICNTVLADTAAALRRADPAVRAGTDLVLITTDPQRDTPAVLRTYLDQFDPRFQGVTADADTIRRAAEAVGVAVGETRAVPGGYEVEHGTQLIGYGRGGTPVLVWSAGTPVGDLRADLTRLVKDGVVGG